jgi:two-component system, cell cycle response regulator
VSTDTINTSAVAARIRALAPGLPLRILIVDDDELERLLLADRLMACGFDITLAASGVEALEALNQQWFPVVITDWQMPGMDGIELTEKLRASGVADTYVIMLTVRDTEFDYDRGYLAGVDDFLSKKQPTTDLLARTYSAFNTLSLRRSLHEARAALAAATASDACGH